MNKAELIVEIAGLSNLPEEKVKGAVDALLKAVGKALKSGDKVQLSGFGSWETRSRAERSGYNLKTKQPLVIKAHRAIKFNVSQVFRDEVVGG